MRIHRSHPDENFTILPNEALRDHRLSYTARGILMELLSHSDGWETNADTLWHLAQKHRGSSKGEGRRAIRAAFADLERCGYLVRRKVQNDRGRFVTVLELYDNTDHRDAGSGTSVQDFAFEESADHHDDRRTAYQTSVDETSVHETSVSGTSLRSTNQRSTNEEVPEQEDPAKLAVARFGALQSAESSDAKTQAALAWGLVDESRQTDEDREARIDSTTQRQGSGVDARVARKARLHELYDAVDRLKDQDLRNALLKFERQRKRIFRDSRNAAIDQIREENAALLQATDASHRIDNLSYKYGLKHYHDEDRDWPAFLIRPLLAGGRGRVA